ncbi:hypothetical protein GLOIN_2v1770212 [Rhizophagus clarus]|uniref:Replication origin-binding protein domain-containing protein n=1 Tax=Rhizophagus clarus TaxID=94130 RepID=A0A8H3QLG3_9GLOM|nr:hypothetical protein GLOIN_2v1770212 [Rhizophagus clarus]
MLLAQKNARPSPKTINDATRLFSNLADLNFESGYNNHIYFQYLSNNKNDIYLLGAYHPEEIYSKYIIRVAEKGFTVVDYPSEIYGLPDTHECIDGNLPLRPVLNIDARQKPDPMNPELPFLDKYKITHEDLLSRILIACADIIYSDLNHFIILNTFALASSSNTNKCSWHIVYKYARFVDYIDLRGFVKKVADRVGKPYSEFIDLGLYKSHFSLQLLGSVKEDRVKRPAVSSVKQEYRKLEDYLVQPKSDYSKIWPRTFSPDKPEKDEFQPIEDETALSKGAGLITAKYEWLEIGHIRKGFVNFQAKLYEACPICRIKHHKGLAFGEASGIIKPKEKPKWRLNDRLINIVKNPRLLSELSGKNINVKEMEEAPEAYPDFLSSVCSMILIRSPIGTGKTKALREILNSLAGNRENLPCFIWVSYRKTLTNKTKAKIEILQNLGLHIYQYQEVEVILDEVNAVIRQMFSGIHARESENAMRDLLKSAIHVVAMDAFANDSTIAFLKQYRSLEVMRRGLKMLREGKRVAFVMTLCKKARALANQAFALQKLDSSPILTRVYFGQMDGMQRQEDFTNINATWSSLDCVIYTSTVEAGISFKIPNHFDTIIGISNIKTGKSSEIFQEPNRSLIHAELFALRLIDLPTAAEYQKRLSVKYFPEIFCSLVFSTGALLEIISTEGTIADRKMVSNIIKAVEENIKGSDAELIINAPDIIPDDAEVLKQISTCSFTDNILLQQYYLWRIYASGDIGGKDDNRDWGFTGIDDIRTLSSNIISEAFKSHAKETPDLKSAIKAINAIAEQFLEKHNLLANSTPEQLSKHAPELDVLLPDWMARRCVKVALANGTNNRRSFSKEKIEALLPDKKKGKLTIEERAEYCAKANDFVDIIANHWALGPKSNDENEIVADVSRQSTFRVKLAEGDVDPAIIEAFAKDQKLIQESNKIQKK